MEAFQLLDVQYRTPEGNTSGSSQRFWVSYILKKKSPLISTFNRKPNFPLFFFRAFAALRRDGVVVTWGDLHHFMSDVPCLVEVCELCATSGAFAARLTDGTVVKPGFVECGKTRGKLLNQVIFEGRNSKKDTSNFKPKKPAKSVAVATISCSFLYVFLNIKIPPNPEVKPKNKGSEWLPNF